MKIEDFDLDNILIDEKSYESNLVYNISYSLIDSKPLHNRSDKIGGFIRVYDGTRYLVLFGSEKWLHLWQDQIPYKCKKQHYIYNFS